MYSSNKAIQEAVIIPVLTSLFSGLMGGIVWLGYALTSHKEAAPALLIGGLAASAAWIFRPQPEGKAPVIQPLTGVQFQQVTKVHVISDDGRAGDYLQFDIERARLLTFARGLAGGRGLTTREWTGRGALFSGSEFSRLRSEMVSRGYARWNSDRDARGGCSLSAKGRATFRALAQLPHPGDSHYPQIMREGR